MTRQPGKTASFQPPAFQSFVALLRHWAETRPERLAYTFLENGETEKERLTFDRLDQKARAIAFHLMRQTRPGERVLLQFPSGLEFLAGFFGCLYAGLIAVPAYPPRPNRKLDRLEAIVADAGARVVLTTGALLGRIQRQINSREPWSNLTWIASDRLEELDAAGAAWTIPSISGDTPAFLQYTSGSTGKPKGVEVSHGNLLHNEALIQTACGHGEDTVFAGWLPLFHDMGLIGIALQPLYLGVPCVLMTPAAFIQKPVRWLRAISRYGATTSGAPNSAYAYCARSISPEQKAGLDLSSWRIAFNGSEPLHPETLEAFQTAFAENGFRPEAFFPCYGMAETTLFVSGGPHAQKPAMLNVDAEALAQHLVKPVTGTQASTRRLVSCGSTWPMLKVAVADPDTGEVLPHGRVGEIRISGGSVARGYWNREQESRRAFGARLAARDAEPALRTGDLGFVEDGELYITGRIKDLIIIRGRNHYPQDIERTAAKSHPALVASGAAAFSLERDGEERLAIVAEVKRTRLRDLDPTPLFEAIREAVAQEHELRAEAIALIKPASLPKTSSGKVQRHLAKKHWIEESLALVAPIHRPGGTPPTPDQESQASEFDERAITAWLQSYISANTGLSPERVETRAPFHRFSLDSHQAVLLSGELQAWLGRPLEPTLIYDFPTIEALARHLASETIGEPNQGEAPSHSQNPGHDDIAVIGLGCRFPGASGPESYWRLLRNAINAVGDLPPARVRDQPEMMGKGGAPSFKGAYLEVVDGFDAPFFSITAREAETMDPQQRLLLEVSWEALEHACIAPNTLAGSRTGVFIGISSQDYTRLQMPHQDATDAYSGTGNAASIAANRISYALDLRGPSWAVDTACSSSLVSVHNACQSLNQGECSLALAGGVNVILSPDLTTIFSNAGMMTPDGACKTFDEAADGYVRGEGCGIVALKRLADALRDGDRIHALIKGTAVGQDGKSNGLTAPRGPAQREAIRAALAKAGTDPTKVAFIECHGTGTALGDPIEVHAIREEYGKNRAPEQTCWLGSVKTQIGHLEAAAGIAGLIKTVLALERAEIPPNLHFHRLNPRIRLEGAPLAVPTAPLPWPEIEGARTAAVSSFGFGGTNAHAVLEAYPQPHSQERPSPDAEQLLCLSAADASALRSLRTAFARFLAESADPSLADICYSANTGRTHFSRRMALIATSSGEAAEGLNSQRSGRVFRTPAEDDIPAMSAPKPVFLFTGQGAQYEGMGKDLYRNQPQFRRTLDRVAALCQPHLERPLLEVMFGDVDQGEANRESQLLHQTLYTQAALFAFEFALARLWQSWGLQPAAVMGHSLGEYVAACIAGVFCLEDAVELVMARAKAMQALPENGGMLALSISPVKLKPLLEGREKQLAVAALNAPDRTVISGEKSALKEIRKRAGDLGMDAQLLKVSHAFHSPLMKPAAKALARSLERVTFQAPQVPMAANLSGRIEDRAFTRPQYWQDQLLNPVRFGEGIRALAEAGFSTFLEIGPRPLLSNLGKENLPQKQCLWLAGSRPGLQGRRTLLESLARLYVRGAEIDWNAFHAGSVHRRLPLPTYPFQRQRYWIPESGSKPRNLGHEGVQRATEPEHFLLGETREAPAHLEHTHIWEKRLHGGNIGFMAGHRIGGLPVMPFAAYAEMAFAAARDVALRPEGLESLELHHPLFFNPNRTMVLQSVLNRDPDGKIGFRVYGREESGPDEQAHSWTHYATLQLNPGVIPDPPSRAPRALAGGAK